MDVKKLFSKLEKSEIFKNFKKDNKDAFFCAGFFILNFKNNVFEYSLDFRDENDMFSFKIPEDNNEIKMIKEPILKNPEAPKPLDKIEVKSISNVKLEVDQLEEFMAQELLKNKITQSLHEIIAVLQNINGKLIWHLTCICESFVIVVVQIDVLTKEIIKFEKKNMMDFMSVKKTDKK